MLGFAQAAQPQPVPAARTRFRIQDRGQCILLAKWQAFGRVEGQGTGNCVVTEIDHGKAGADPPRP